METYALIAGYCVMFTSVYVILYAHALLMCLGANVNTSTLSDGNLGPGVFWLKTSGN
jgi:hypothetical protein